jgi:hypothetical protein
MKNLMCLQLIDRRRPGSWACNSSLWSKEWCGDEVGEEVILLLIVCLSTVSRIESTGINKWICRWVQNRRHMEGPRCLQLIAGILGLQLEPMVERVVWWWSGGRIINRKLVDCIRWFQNRRHMENPECLRLTYGRPWACNYNLWSKARRSEVKL